MSMSQPLCQFYNLIYYVQREEVINSSEQCSSTCFPFCENLEKGGWDFCLKLGNPGTSVIIYMILQLPENINIIF